MAAPACDRELSRLTDLCVRCGLCLPHCPTYRLAREEGESPRGRIALAAALSTQPMLAQDAALRRHLDQCLFCRACERVCPAQVPFAQIMIRARAHLLPRRDRSRLWRLAVFLLARPPLWRTALASLRVAERLGLMPLLLRLHLRPELAVLPPLGARWRPRRGISGRPVYLFEGCVSSRLAAGAFRAAEQILQRLGYQALGARAPHCCGAALAHEGYTAAAARLAARLPRAYPGSAPVLLLDSGCLEAAGRALGERAKDIHAFLLEHDLPTRVGWKRPLSSAILHRPCTLRANAAAQQALDRLLAAVPTHSLQELPERDACCGAAGLGFLEARAQSLGLRSELDQDASAPLLSPNVGCRVWLTAGRQPCPGAGPVYHPVEYLAASIEP